MVACVVVQLMPVDGNFETAALPRPVRPDGGFTVDSLCLEEIDQGAWWNLEVMRKYAGQGTPARIEVNGRVQINLRVLS